MTNQIAIVTGAGGKGCGRAIALRFAREGAAVVAADINEVGARETARAIQDAGGRAISVRADVRDEEQMRALVELAERTFGGLTILVNNASAPAYPPAGVFANWSDNVLTDLVGALYGARLAIEPMRRAGGGAIVNVSSISALWHGRRRKAGISPAYDAAKAGLLRMTTVLAPLLEADHIRVNCLAPGWIATPGPLEYWESLTPQERQDIGAPSRLLTSDEVASAVLYLATDKALTGRVLVWWSDRTPQLVTWGDRGYESATEITLG